MADHARITHVTTEVAESLPSSAYVTQTTTEVAELLPSSVRMSHYVIEVIVGPATPITNNTGGFFLFL